jgi:putative ABC transport system permease protein
MRLRHVLVALASHWRRQRIQFATLLIGLAAATALWCGVQALNTEARASYARAEAVLGGAGIATVRARDGGRFPLSDYVALRRAGWPVSPVLEGDLRSGTGYLRIIGIDPLSGPPPTEALDIGDGARAFVDFVRPPGIAYASPRTVAALEGTATLPPLRASDTLPPDTLLVDIGAAERLLDVRGRLSRLLLPADQADRALPETVSDRLSIVPPATEGDLSRLTDSFHLNLTAFGFLSFVVGLFIVYSAIGLTFEERKPMIRTLRACGVSARQLAAALLIELLAIASVAGLVGTVIGYVIAASLLPDVAASLRGLYGAHVSGTLALSPAWWLAGMGISLGGACVAAASSIWRAWRLPVLATAQPEAWQAAARRGRRLQSVAALLLAALTLWLLLRGAGLAAGFAAMGGLLLSAALILPVLLSGLLSLGGRRARGPLLRWAFADSRQELSGLSLALMALLLALAVNLGVGTMVKSFRETFVTYLDQRLAQEIYVVADSDEAAAAIADRLAARPEVTAVLPFWQAETRIAGWPVEVNGYDAQATYRENWPLIRARPDAWDRVSAGGSVLVSEQLARRAGLAVGDSLDLPTPSGTWSVNVAGIYPDYGNPSGQIIADRATMGRHWPAADRRRVGGRADPADVDRVLADIRREFSLGPEQVYDQTEVKALSMRIFEQTFAVTVALNVLTLIVAGIALLTSLLTLSNARLSRLAPLWALGLTQRTLSLVEIAKTLGLAAFTALAALPLGQAVAWVLTAVINVRAFGWRLPVHAYPAQWLTLAALALGTALLAAIWPAIRLHRAAPADLLRTFSNER